MNWSASLARLEIALQSANAATAGLREPGPYSVRPAGFDEARATLRESEADLRHEFAHWREQLAHGFDLRPLPGLDVILRQNGAGRFSLPPILEGEDIERAEAACLGAIRESETQIEILARQYERDKQRVMEAHELAQSGEIRKAQETLEQASRLFKGVPYHEVDLALGQWSGLGAERGWVEQKREAINAEIEKLQRAFYVSEKSRRIAREAIDDLMAELERRRSNAAVDGDESLRQRWAAYATLMKRWHDHQIEALDDLARRHRTRGRLVQHLAVTAAALGFWGVASICFYMTGYRFIGPDGASHEERFLWPGERTIRFEDYQYWPFEKEVEVKLCRVTNIGKIERSEMRRMTRLLDLDSKPSGCAFELRDVEGNLIVKGTTPRRDIQLPMGSYSLILTCGTITERSHLEVSFETPMFLLPVLPAANLTIETKPPGALVYENGKPLGLTAETLHLVGLTPGVHQFEFRLGDFHMPLPLELQPGEDKKLVQTFGFGAMKIASDPPGAKIRFLNTDVAGGTTPFHLDSTLAREYHFEATYPGLEAKLGMVAVEPNKTAMAMAKLDYATLLIRSVPLGARVAFQGMKLTDGKTPYAQPVVRPGTYTAQVALGPATESLTFTVKAGDRETLDVPFKKGRLRVTSEPPGARVSFPDMDLPDATTPGDLEVVAGKRWVLFLNDGVTKRRPVNVPENGVADLKVRFLKQLLAPEIKKGPPEHHFAGDTLLGEGKGLNSAQVGGPVDVAVQKLGLPDDIMSVDDPEQGSIELLFYRKEGVTIATDGNEILSITIIAAPAAETTPLKFFTTKGVGIGSSEEQVRRAYGEPLSHTPTTLNYPGLEICFQHSDGGIAVVSLRVKKGG